LAFRPFFFAGVLFWALQHAYIPADVYFTGTNKTNNVPPNDAIADAEPEYNNGIITLGKFSGS